MWLVPRTVWEEGRRERRHRPKAWGRLPVPAGDGCNIPQQIEGVPFTQTESITHDIKIRGNTVSRTLGGRIGAHQYRRDPCCEAECGNHADQEDQKGYKLN